MLFSGRIRVARIRGRRIAADVNPNRRLQWESVFVSLIRSTDPDFRVCQVSFYTLLAIQSEAERRGWATRWSSEDALRRQVGEDAVILQTLMREEQGGSIRAYRCLMLFSTADGSGVGGIATIDLDPARLELVERIDRDPDVRRALVRMFSLAMRGISMLSKE